MIFTKLFPFLQTPPPFPFVLMPCTDELAVDHLHAWWRGRLSIVQWLCCRDQATGRTTAETESAQCTIHTQYPLCPAACIFQCATRTSVIDLSGHRERQRPSKTAGLFVWLKTNGSTSFLNGSWSLIAYITESALIEDKLLVQMCFSSHLGWKWVVGFYKFHIKGLQVSCP